MSSHPNLTVVDHPLVADKLSRLRAASTRPSEFRRLVHELATLLTYAATTDLPLRAVPVETPLETAECRRLAGPVTVVPVLRAGLGMTQGVLELLPEARVGHVGLFRDEETLEAVPYYRKLPPDAADGLVMLVDPMLATGHTAVSATGQLRDAGCRDIRMLCLVAAPPGVANMAEHHPDVPIVAAALDRELDARGYILPGLGDAGDRQFGT